jgi:hypothetical protein
MSRRKKHSQHTSPCKECPWRRKSPRGWLGGVVPADVYVATAHGEGQIDCHMMTDVQCAGAGIFRSNVLKDPRNKKLLVLPRDHAEVFSSSEEFLKHHTLKPTL